MQFFSSAKSVPRTAAKLTLVDSFGSCASAAELSFTPFLGLVMLMAGSGSLLDGVTSAFAFSFSFGLGAPKPYDSRASLASF